MTDVHPYLKPQPRYSAQELLLPDAGFILGRFLIGCWEEGLIGIDDNVAEYVALAVRVLLKNLLSSIIMKRRHYKVTGGGAFYYDVGAQLKNPEIRNTVTRNKIDDGPLEIDKEITSPNFTIPPNDAPVSLAACEDLYVHLFK